MTVAVVERFLEKQESMYGLSVGPTKVTVGRGGR